MILMADRELWTVAETAAELGMSIRGILNRLEKGQMKGEKVTPRLWLIPRVEVEAWVTRGRLKVGRPRREPPAPPEEAP